MLILKKPFDKLWKGKDAFEEVEKISGEVYRSVATRQTLRFEVDGKGYYLKLHHGITYKEFFKNVFSLHAPVLGAGNEWRRCFREELEPRGWFNVYAQYIREFSMDDTETGVGSASLLLKI